MQECKNVGLTVLDLGGVLLPPGGTAVVDPDSAPVAGHLADGTLTPVQGGQQRARNTINKPAPEER